jgi:4-aminobutyrate aminotransferase-like enzyme
MCAEMMRLQIEKGVNGPVAGVIVEPIQASGGQIVFPGAYLQKVREICDEYGTLLIFDEIQTYCRIGKYFAADYFGVTPDIIVLGKALGAGLPIAAIIIHDRLKGFEMKAEELHTCANNSASQVAALKQLEIRERDHILDNTNAVGARLCDGLIRLREKYPQIGDVRQAGLHIGAEMIEPDGKPLSGQAAMKLRETAMDEGIILGTGGYRKNLLKFKPPLITSAAEADEILERFEKTLKKTF